MYIIYIIYVYFTFILYMYIILYIYILYIYIIYVYILYICGNILARHNATSFILHVLTSGKEFPFLSFQ